MNKNLLLKVCTGFLILFVFAFSPPSVKASETLKNGSWKDTLSWSTNSIPGELITTIIKHRIHISGSIKTGNIEVFPGGELYFSNAEGIVNLDCGSILVHPGGLVTADSTLTGLYLKSGDIILQKSVSDTGSFISNCIGLNMTCGGIQNDGILKLRTSNYMTVNGDIINNGLFVYTGNGIQLYGHKLIQENPNALWEVAGINYQMNWSHPQYLGTDTVPLSIGGTIQLKGTRFYSYGSRLRPLTKGSAMYFDGGYFAGVKADSLIIKGENQFYIGSSILTDCITEGTIDCSSFTMLGKTIMNGTIQSRGASPLIISGDATLNGVLKKQTNGTLAVSYCGSITNNGIMDSISIIGYGNPNFVNNNTIKATGITLYSYLSGDNLTSRNEGLKIFENNGLIEGNVSFDTTYTILSRSVGTWTGAIYSGLQNGFRSMLKGSHQFTQCIVQNFGSEMDDVITMTRSQLINFKGGKTKIFMKSGCSITKVEDCEMTAYGALEINEVNSGILIAKDSLSYSYPATFKGHLETNGLVLAQRNNSYLKSEGVWINNGTVVNQNMDQGITVGGTFVNNGTVNTNTGVYGLNGRIFQNGTWASNKQISYTLDAQANCMLWMVKPTTLNLPLYMSPNTGFSTISSQIYTKNNRPVATFFHTSISIADTGMYRVKDAAPYTAKASNYITYHNPFGFITPLANDSTVRESVTFRWNKIPGATGYKIRLISKANGNDYTFGMDSVMSGDTSLVFSKLGQNIYYAYFSVQFGYDGNYTWSHESGAHRINLTGSSAPKIVDEDKLNAGDIAIVQVNSRYRSFDFVTLRKIKKGSILYFTDYSYSKAKSDFDKTTTLNDVYTFTAADDIAAGTVIQSLNNRNFDKSNINFDSGSATGYYQTGETIIAYQIAEGADTTYLSAFGWKRTNNFVKGNTSSKFSDIPKGLSLEDHTVIQMDSAQYNVRVENFRYNKYDGFTGTKKQLLTWFSDPSNYNTYAGAINNDIVPVFNVLEPDITAPNLIASYPSSDKMNVSVNSDGEFVFSEKVTIKKGLKLKLASSGMITIYDSIQVDEMFVLDDSTVVFPMEGFLRSSNNYSLLVPEGFVSDENGNGWPSSGSLTIPFSTNTLGNRIVLDFDSTSTEGLKWKTTGTKMTEMGLSNIGYASFTMKGIPMRLYCSLSDSTIYSKDTILGKIRINNPTLGSRLVVDFTGVNKVVNNINSHLYANYGAFMTKVYRDGWVSNEKKIYNTSGSLNRYMINPEYGFGYVKQYYDNEKALKVDSVVYSGLEGAVIRLEMELADLTSVGGAGNSMASELTIYPNPAVGAANISLNLLKGGSATIKIYDLSGKSVATFNENLLEGRNSIRCDLKGLSGIYLLKVSTPDGTFIEKLMVK